MTGTQLNGYNCKLDILRPCLISLTTHRMEMWLPIPMDYSTLGLRLDFVWSVVQDDLATLTARVAALEAILQNQLNSRIIYGFFKAFPLLQLLLVSEQMT